MKIPQWDFQNKGTLTSPARLSFVLKIPLRHLRPSVIYSVPCDRILQRAYWNMTANQKTANHKYCFSTNQRKKQNLVFQHMIRQANVSCPPLVQSMNSSFFPPLVGTKPGRAKEESRITCMRTLRAPPFSPQIGGNPYLEILSRFGWWRNFLNNSV